MATGNNCQSIILTGPPGCGKSFWIQQYAKEIKKDLCICPCRKDRTLRDGRQKLHTWARRTEPTILWLEGADDLTPEAQAFLRRILETHASSTQFILECRDPGRLQEPIRSRCVVKRLHYPTFDTIVQTYNIQDDLMNDLKRVLNYQTYSWRRVKHILYLYNNFPERWKQFAEHTRKEEEFIQNVTNNDIPYSIEKAYNPEKLFEKYLINDNVFKEYGQCIDIVGSLWAFASYALPNALETKTLHPNEISG